jgi:hypothetical protein
MTVGTGKRDRRIYWITWVMFAMSLYADSPVYAPVPFVSPYKETRTCLRELHAAGNHMTKDEAINKALEYANSVGITAAGDAEAEYFNLARLDALATACSDDMVKTYRSVRSKFQNHWAVTIPLGEAPGTVASPASAVVQVFDSGEVALLDSL